MRFIHFTGGNGYCGCDIDEYVAFEDGTDDIVIDMYANKLAEENGETYEYVATGWDIDWESEEEREMYYENCYCDWEEISEEEFEEGRG